MITIPTSDVELFQLCADGKRKTMWVLYERPYDFPTKWVARFFVCDLDKDFRPRGTRFFEPGKSRSEIEHNLPYFDKGRWKFTPEYDPQNPQIIGVYT